MRIAPGSTGRPIFNEVPSGSINDVNVMFTLAHTPVAGTLALYLNGSRLQSGSGNDYTLSGVTITLASAPLTGSNILADYEY
jgi:hypothetical protein